MLKTNFKSLWKSASYRKRFCRNYTLQPPKVSSQLHYTGTKQWPEPIIEKPTFHSSKFEVAKKYDDIIRRSHYLIFHYKKKSLPGFGEMSKVCFDNGFRLSSIHHHTMTAILRPTPLNSLVDICPTSGFIYYNHDPLPSGIDPLTRTTNLYSLLSPMPGLTLLSVKIDSIIYDSASYKKVILSTDMDKAQDYILENITPDKYGFIDLLKQGNPQTEAVRSFLKKL